MAHKTSVMADETLVSLTECGICLLEMKNPKALPCLHSFCLECLKEVKHPPGIFICPLCQEQMVLPSGGVEGLRDNFFINQLKEWKAIQKIGEVKIPCVCCESTDQDTKARCVDCNGFLCQQCISSHKTLKPLTGHTIFSIDELKSGKINMSEMTKEVSCHTHKDQVMRWFCKTCNISICRDCTVMDHVRPDHDYTTIEIATEGQKEEIKKLMSNSEGLSKQMKDAVDETDEVKNNLNKAVDNIKTELDQERKAYMESIQRSYEANMEKLAEIQKEAMEKINSTIKGFEFMQSKLNNAMEIASQVTKSGSMHNVASNYSTLCTTLTQLQDLKPCGISKSVGVVKFKPSQKGKEKTVDFGTVSKGRRLRDGNGRWVFEKDIVKQDDTDCVYGIAVSPNRSFLVADHEARNITIFDQEGIMKQKIKANLNHPNDIAITSSRFYVADRSSYIKSFTHDDVKQIPAISPDGNASDTDRSELHGIATDNDGNIVIGNYTKQYISKHKPNGTHISSFPIGIIGIKPWYVKVTANGSIVVSSFRKCAPALILDPYGKLLHTIKPTNAKVWKPSGIACSDDGSVFIASYNDGIYHFTEDGEYLGCVSQDVHEATGLDIYDDNKLVVAQWLGYPVKIYTYEE